MDVLFYENPQKTLKIYLENSGNPFYEAIGVDSALISLGEEDDEQPFFLPAEYIKNVPLEDSKIEKFLEELKKFNPSLLEEVRNIGETEKGLVAALRETRKNLEEEIAMEKGWEKMGKENKTLKYELDKPL